MSVPVIEFEHVSCSYGGPKPILENINLHIHKGQFAGILGPSGAGKTTLLKSALGLLSPAHGTIRINGEPMRGKPSQRIAYVPQVETVDWNFPLSVEQAVLMGRTAQSRLLPWPSRDERSLAGEMMERLGIAPFAKRHIRELSGGQQQRVFLARALIAQPDLLILDEPTAGVDMRTQEEILHLLVELNHQGMTILMTTHDLNAAATHLPWVVCLNRTIIAQGTPDDVFVPETLNATYCGDMVVVRQDGLIFVQERPHHHNVKDVHPAPVLSHAVQPNADPRRKTGEAERIDLTIAEKIAEQNQRELEDYASGSIARAI
jgi:ABC-type Mn2+/Zn2+ transport system ATPase subunit